MDEKQNEFLKKAEFQDDVELVIKKKAKSSASQEGGDSSEKKSKFTLFVENFFYHYKWHTLVALFLVFAITFCTLQTCNKTNFDLHVLYAGGKNLRVFHAEDGESTLQPLYTEAQKFTPDFDGDGNIKLSIVDLYLPSNEEIDKIEASGGSVNYTLLYDNGEQIRYHMKSGEYYICLLSKSLFDEWTKNESSNPFAKISDYLPHTTPEGVSFSLASEYGVYLCSTGLSDNDGFKNLPDDTVICFKRFFEKQSGKRYNYYRQAEEALKNMLCDTRQ